MKKLFSVSLVVVMVLAMGSFAMANGLNGQLEAEIPVEATIGAYAQLIVEEGIDFGLITQPVGTHRAGGIISVESNVDVKIDLKVENENWIQVPYKFGALVGEGSRTPLVEIGTYDDLNTSGLFSQPYSGRKEFFNVVGEFIIDSISQLPAGEFGTNIVVTVSQ